MAVMRKDPVCKMIIEEAAAVESVDHGGTTYYFCSKACAEQFRNDVDSYTQAPARAERRSPDLQPAQPEAGFPQA